MNINNIQVMQYMGSKRRIANQILPIVLKDRKPNQLYIEPFVGGCNMIDKVDGRRLGNDKHYYLIAMWKALQNGWIPPNEITKGFYYEIKKNKTLYNPALVGFVGFHCSFGGKWWNGYAFNSKNDNYAKRGASVLLKQIQKLKDVEFTNLEYWEIHLEENSIIYCDPPYQNVSGYKDEINHEHFWQWCRDLSLKGYQVFISEYYAPNDFECLVTIQHKTILNKNSQDPRTEKLFRFKG